MMQIQMVIFTKITQHEHFLVFGILSNKKVKLLYL